MASFCAETYPAVYGPKAKPTKVVAKKNVAVAVPRILGKTSAWLLAAAAPSADAASAPTTTFRIKKSVKLSVVY